MYKIHDKGRLFDAILNYFGMETLAEELLGMEEAIDALYELFERKKESSILEFLEENLDLEDVYLIDWGLVKE